MNGGMNSLKLYWIGKKLHGRTLGAIVKEKLFRKERLSICHSKKDSNEHFCKERV